MGRFRGNSPIYLYMHVHTHMGHGSFQMLIVDKSYAPQLKVRLTVAKLKVWNL